MPGESAPQLAIDAVGLAKSFGDQHALTGLDLAVPEGSVTALIGPNGSGKTTTIRILSTLLAPDAGRAAVFGHDVVAEPEAVRAAIGVTGQFSAVDKFLTGRENLALMARLHHLRRPVALERTAGNLERFELTDAADRPVITYSGGMRRRLDLAMTLMGEPRIVFLDEPTTGLDPRGRKVLADRPGLGRRRSDRPAEHRRSTWKKRIAWPTVWSSSTVVPWSQKARRPS